MAKNKLTAKKIFVKLFNKRYRKGKPLLIFFLFFPHDFFFIIFFV